MGRVDLRFFQIRGRSVLQQKQRDEEELMRLLLSRVDEFPMSTRSRNCLRESNNIILLDLVQRSETEMLRVSSFGNKSLEEVKGILDSLGLSFRMTMVRDPKMVVEKYNLIWSTGEVAIHDVDSLAKSLGIEY